MQSRSYRKHTQGYHKELRCLYTKTQHLGNKRGELEILVHKCKYDIVALTEAWWDEIHAWKFSDRKIQTIQKTTTKNLDLT